MNTLTEQQLIDVLPRIKISIEEARKASEEFGISDYYFKTIRVLLGYTTPKKVTTTKETRKEIVEALKAGEHPIEISRRTGIKGSYLRSIADRNHIEFSMRNFWTERKVMKLVQLRNSGMPYKDIAPIIGCTEDSAEKMASSLAQGKNKKWAPAYEKTPGIKNFKQRV